MELMFSLLSTQHAVPGKVLLERVCPFGPVFVPDQASQVRMPLRNQSEHVANLPFVPLSGMNVRRDGGEQPIVSGELSGQQHPAAGRFQCEQIVQSIGVANGAIVDTP